MYIIQHKSQSLKLNSTGQNGGEGGEDGRGGYGVNITGIIDFNKCKEFLITEQICTYEQLQSLEDMST